MKTRRATVTAAASSRTACSSRLLDSFRLKSRGSGFTIIEIALCLAIIGFALVAIIAVLPRGLNVQKRNREETIIGHDAEVWMNSLRTGARGYDDLTNYIGCVTNFWTRFKADGTVDTSGTDYYTTTNSGVTSIAQPADYFMLTNGARIVGLLSTPKLTTSQDPVHPIGVPTYAPPPYQSNYVIAYVRAFSGPAVDKVPENNGSILADAFTYRMIVENFSSTPADTNAFCFNCPAFYDATNGLTSAAQVTAALVSRTNLAHVTWMLQTNTHDLRLRFRWPVLPNGEIPSYGQLTFRGLASGNLVQTNDTDAPLQPIYFVQSSVYVQGSRNSP